MAMTQKFTAEEVRENIAANRRHMTTETELQLTAYADTLSKPADSGRVGMPNASVLLKDGTVVVESSLKKLPDGEYQLVWSADSSINRAYALAAQGKSESAKWEAIVQHCMVTDAVTPDESDPYGTISRVIDWHQANTSLAAQGQGELAGYVDPEQVAEVQKNEVAAVSIGTFSERYGRTVPVYFHPAPPASPTGVPELHGWTLKLMRDRDGDMSIWACDPDGSSVYLAAAPSAPEGDGGAE